MNRSVQLPLLVLVIALVLAACTSGGSASFNYGGQWVGTINDSVAGSGNVSVSMSQAGTDLVGTWQATFSEGSNSGNAIGIVNDDQVILELHPSVSTACPYELVATRSGNTLSGNYSAFNCTQSVSGTMTVTKQ